MSVPTVKKSKLAISCLMLNLIKTLFNVPGVARNRVNGPRLTVTLGVAVSIVVDVASD